VGAFGLVSPWDGVETFRLSVVGSPLHARPRGDDAHASKIFWVVCRVLAAFWPLSPNSPRSDTDCKFAGFTPSVVRIHSYPNLRYRPHPRTAFPATGPACAARAWNAAGRERRCGRYLERRAALSSRCGSVTARGPAKARNCKPRSWVAGRPGDSLPPRRVRWQNNDWSEISRTCCTIRPRPRSLSGATSTLTRTGAISYREVNYRHYVPGKPGRKSRAEALMPGKVRCYEAFTSMALGLAFPSLGSCIAVPTRQRAHFEDWYKFEDLKRRGFFLGKLGRNKVCAVFEPDVELPSDLHASVRGVNGSTTFVREIKAALKLWSGRLIGIRTHSKSLQIRCRSFA